jgi:hypothetical protein
MQFLTLLDDLKKEMLWDKSAQFINRFGLPALKTGAMHFLVGKKEY